MRIDFSFIPESSQAGMHGGAGEITSKVYEDSSRKVTPCRIHPGSSIGMHSHENGSEICYVLYGTDFAVCDGVQEPLSTDICHICPKGSSHSITNTGLTDLVMLMVES